MKLSASEAARQTGKSIPTITRAIKSGKISAEKARKGGYLIDPAELFRAFPALTRPNAEISSKLDSETSPPTPFETRSLHEKVAGLEAALADAKVERDEWRDQAKRLAMTLPAPEAAKPEGKGAMGLWKRIFG